MADDGMDERSMQELSELQDKIIRQSTVLDRLDTQQRMCGVHRQRSVLTKTELEAMPEGTPMYKSIGRAYFLSAQKDVLTDLDARVASSDADIKNIKEQREALDVKMRDTESQMRELIKATPALARRLGGIKI